MTKPVDLIVANDLHDLAANIERLPKDGRDAVNMTSLSTEVARKLLCIIAHQASLPAVIKALEAVGVCGGVDAIGQQLAAVIEKRAEEHRAAGIDPAQEAATKRAAVDDIMRKIVTGLREELGAEVIVGEPVKVKG